MTMTVCTADFERGTNGATISASDAGSLTAWDQVDIGGTGSVAAYSTTYAAHGNRGARLKNATSGVTALHSGGGSGTEQWGRCYVKPVAYPSSGAMNFLRFFNGGGQVYVITWDSSGLLALNGSSLTNPLPIGQWVRLEWHLVHSTTVGIADLRLFLDADSTIPTEMKQATSQNTGTDGAALVIGNSGSSGTTYEIGLDQYVAAAPALPGPYPVSTNAPTVAGGTAVGSTLYCDGGTFNSGAQFSLAYQWTRDGSSIGGATSPSYLTTEPSDYGHVIGCTVTATGLVATNETLAVASSNTITIGTVTPITTGHFVCRTISRELLDIVIALPIATELDSVDCE